MLSSIQPVLKNLQLTNFRGFEQLELKQLNRANLIVGGNNTGKTSILEALVLLGGAEKQIKSLPTTFRPAPDFQDEYGQQTSDARQILEESYWLWLYREKDSSQGFSLSCTLSDGSSWISQSARSRKGFRGYENGQTGANPEKQWIDVGSQSLFIGKTPESKTGALNVISSGASNPTRDAELFNLVAPLDPDGEDEIEAAMRVIDTRVKRLRYARLPGTTSPQIFVDVGLRKAIPSTQLGQAFGRMLHMNCLLMAKRSPLLLVDEIENGLYFENLGAFWAASLN